MLKIYTLSNCDTCRRATKWLRAHDLAFEELAIRETPPTTRELRVALTVQGGEVRKLFNTAGRDYREQKLGEKLVTIGEPEALRLLSNNGNLIKRPFLVGPDVVLVGFDEVVWRARLWAK